MLYRGNLRLLLSGPGGPGAGSALPGGALPEPGGWNRMALGVSDLAAAVRRLRRQGARLRAVPAGVTVSQVLVEDPDGNLVELFEPGPGYHERAPGPADVSPADTSPADTSPASTGPASTGPAGTDTAPRPGHTRHLTAPDSGPADTGTAPDTGTTPGTPDGEA
jgi:hypothetical protein